MALLLGIDAGTTSVSAAVFDSEAGDIAAVESIPHHASIEGTARLRSEHDLGVVWKAVSDVILRCKRTVHGDGAKKPFAVDAVCVTGQMHGFCLLDRDGVAVTPLITWQDRRALEIVPGGSSRLDQYRELTRDLAPASAAPGYAAVNIFCLARDRAIPASAAHFATVHEWLLSRLAGRAVARTDPTFAHSTGLSAPAGSAWRYDLIDAIAIDPSLFPRIAPAGTEIGTTNGTANGLAGILRDGIPVFVGLGDNQASFLASAGVSDISVNIGTGGQISVALETFKEIGGLDTRPFVDGRYLLVGAPLCGGRAYAILGEFFRETGRLLFDSTISDDELYDRMRRIARFDTEMTCRTSFAGSRTDPDLLGEISRIGTGDLHPALLAGCFIKGMAYEFGELYRSMGTPRRGAVASGNTVRNNEPLRKALEEALEIDVRVSDLREEAAVGAALTAGVGVGVFASFAEASRATDTAAL